MRPLEPCDRLVVAAEHEGLGRKQLEVLRGERSDLMGSRQRLVRLEPRPLRVGQTALLEPDSSLHRAILDQAARAVHVHPLAFSL